MTSNSNSSNTVGIRAKIDVTLYAKILQFKKDNGIAYEAEVIRMALTRFFDSNNEKLIHKPLNKSL